MSELASRPVFCNSFSGETGTLEWIYRFFALAAQSGRLFRTPDGTLLFIDGAQGPRRLLQVQEFAGIVPSLVDVRAPSRHGEGSYPTQLDPNKVSLLFHSEGRRALPLVEAVVPDPVVAWDNKRQRYLLVDEPGFHKELGIYYWAQPGTAPIKARDSTKYLEQCFSGVPFAAPGHRSNVFAWLLGGVVLDKRITTPLMAVTGNDRAVGKSSLVQACGVILTGEMQSPIQHRGSEMEKQLSAKFLDNERFISIDNVVTPKGSSFKNERLARLLTDGWSKRVRILGQSRNIAQTGVLFAASMNDCKLDPDLATRSLPVKLYREVPGPMVPYCIEEAFAHRAEIYGELLGLAMRVSERRSAVFEGFRFQRWLRFVQPRIEAHFHEMALKIVDVHEFDDRVQDLISYGLDHVGESFTADDLAALVRSDSTRFPGLTDALEAGKGRRGKTIRMGKLLTQYEGMETPAAPGVTLRLTAEPTSASNKKPKTYVFEEV